MKRKLNVSILGIPAGCALVASAYGQGQISFANYAPDDPGSPSAPVTLEPGNILVGSEFSAELLYQYPGMTGGIYASMDPSGGYDLAEDGAGNVAVAQFYGSDGNAASGAGLFVFNGPNGSAVTIPGYTGNPLVTFEVYVFDSVPNGIAFVGMSAPFTMTLPSMGNPLGDLFNNGVLTPGSVLTPITIVTPEPSTFALVGVGAVALFALRRRK